MLGRSRESKNSARAFSVHACIHYLNCGNCDMTCTQILNLSILKAVGVLGSFCPWLNCTASSRKRCCLAYPLSLQRVANRCDGENTSSVFYRASRVMHWEAPCRVPVCYISNIRSWLLSSTEPKWTFGLADLWMVLYS